MSPTPDSNTITQSSTDSTARFKRIIKSNGINDPVSEVIVQESGLIGENMASKTYLVTVKFEESNKKPLNLFMKTLTENPSHTVVMEEAKSFVKETRFFMEYLPAVQKFCKEMGQEDLLKIYPKCYYGDDKMIAFENLVVDKGFVLLNKINQQDFETAKVALAGLAKHHAISYAYIKSAGGPDKVFRQFPDLDFEPFLKTGLGEQILKPAVEGAFAQSIDILKKSGIGGRAEAIRAFEAMTGNMWSEFVKCFSEISQEEKNRLILAHGDYWNNNMMFRMDKQTGKIIDYVMVDFQVLRYNNAVNDLAYYLFTSVKPEVRQAQLKALLQHYLSILNIVTLELGHPIDLSYDELFMDYRKKFKAGFFMGIVMSYGAMYEVMKDIDPNELDMVDVGAKLGELTQKWLDEHPERCKQLAEKLVKVIKEYTQLKLH